MTAQITPYLFLGGRCEEAIEFYRAAVGAERVFSMRYKDNPEPMPPGAIPAGWEEKVMHATLNIGGATLMLSDGCEAGTGFGGFSLSLAFATEAEADRAFNALAEGGQVRMPMTRTFWSPRFGMVADKFGVAWMVTVGAVGSSQ